MTTMTLVAVPTDGRGSPGDGPGMLAISASGQLFYCVKQYNGVDKIWLFTAAGLPLQMLPPAPPVITGSSVNIPPLITGTLSSPIQAGYNRKIFVYGSLKTASSSAVGVTSFAGYNIGVTGSNWSFQVPATSGMYPYSPGVWEITATSLFQALNGTNASNSSASSNTFTVTLSGPPIVIPAPTVNLRVSGPWGGAVDGNSTSGTIFWQTTNATKLSMTGPQGSRELPPTTVIDNITVRKATSGTYVFTATGPGGKTVNSISVMIQK